MQHDNSTANKSLWYNALRVDFNEDKVITPELQAHDVDINGILKYIDSPWLLNYLSLIKHCVFCYNELVIKQVHRDCR